MVSTRNESNAGEVPRESMPVEMTEHRRQRLSEGSGRMTERILITGGSGAVATNIRPLLARADREVILLDILEPVIQPTSGERFILASITDMEAVTAASSDVDLVVHLGGFAGELAWTDILETNINGGYTVLEAAHRSGVPRVLLASSIHAVGYLSAAESREQRTPHARPDTYYGVSKVAVEALGQLYADRCGMTVVSARFGTAEVEPSSARSLSVWVSPADIVRLIEAVLAQTAPGGHLVWGVSNNTRRWVSLAAGLEIGFAPQDDAEVYAPALGNPELLPLSSLLAGGFIDPSYPLGGAR